MRMLCTYFLPSSSCYCCQLCELFAAVRPRVVGQFGTDLPRSSVVVVDD